ncbi:MAG: hypothetical protein FWH36_04310 [Lentimicrobiaceae bacterium]|nr:hypothetical protein [Lentimicrobiaceae bacterium]
MINCTHERGYNIIVSPNHKCDIYLFDNYFAIVRKTFFYTYAPVFITPDVERTREITGFSTVYKPSNISFFQKKSRKITFEIENEIVFKDFMLFVGGKSKYFQTIITLNNLTDGQITYFEQIENWRE